MRHDGILFIYDLLTTYARKNPGRQAPCHRCGSTSAARNSALDLDVNGLAPSVRDLLDDSRWGYLTVIKWRAGYTTCPAAQPLAQAHWKL